MSANSAKDLYNAMLNAVLRQMVSQEAEERAEADIQIRMYEDAATKERKIKRVPQGHHVLSGMFNGEDDKPVETYRRMSSMYDPDIEDVEPADLFTNPGSSSPMYHDAAGDLFMSELARSESPQPGMIEQTPMLRNLSIHGPRFIGAIPRSTFLPPHPSIGDMFFVKSLDSYRVWDGHQWIPWEG